MMQVVAQTIKSCLDELPGYPRTQIGFATFDSTIHFYNMKVCLSIDAVCLHIVFSHTCVNCILLYLSSLP